MVNSAIHRFTTEERSRVYKVTDTLVSRSEYHMMHKAGSDGAMDSFLFSIVMLNLFLSNT